MLCSGWGLGKRRVGVHRRGGSPPSIAVCVFPAPTTIATAHRSTLWTWGSTSRSIRASTTDALWAVRRTLGARVACTVLARVQGSWKGRGPSAVAASTASAALSMSIYPRARAGWRNTLDFDPLEISGNWSYLEAVLYPLADAVRLAAKPSTRVSTAGV